MVGCSNEKCKKWLHEECLKHDVLLRVYEELGADKPHKAADVKEEKEEEEARRPLSPVEPGTSSVATELPIQVKTDGEGDSVKANDSVDVKEESKAVTEESPAQPPNGRASTAQTPTGSTPARKVGRGRKKADASEQNSRPYEGLFEATFLSQEDKFLITDLRTGVEGGEKTWKEEVKCLVCGTTFVSES